MKERIRNLKISLLYRFARLFPDRLFLELLFPLRTGYKLNLKAPQTFNEKLQWLKLYDRKPEYTQMVDKLEAKKYVANIIGEEHIIPTLAVYDRVEDINFDALPNRFVLKCTHDSGGIVICKDKATLDRRAAIEKPQSFEEMKRLAAKLSKGLPQVRVDFYDVNGHVYFGELTFFHWSGMTPFNPIEWDKKFGEKIKIPELYD